MNLKIGMLGYSEGNGHPYSYSAIFNGYNAEALETRCPFPVIRDYLPREQGNRLFVPGVRVSHVWTQSREISDSIASVSKIETIVDRIEDMIGRVDAIVLARDDIEKHWEIARPIVEAGVPLFIDKQLVATDSELDSLLSLVDARYPLMAGSSVRFSEDVGAAAKALAGKKIKRLIATSPGTWLKYGHHLLEGITRILGTEVDAVEGRNPTDGAPGEEIVLRYPGDTEAILRFGALYKGIDFVATDANGSELVFAFKDFFHSFRRMLISFTGVVRGESRPYSFSEMIQLSKIVLEGQKCISKTSSR